MSNNIIEEVMVTTNLSLRKIAKMIGYDVSALSRVMNGKQKMSYRMAYQISQVFGLDLDRILKVEGIK